MTGAGEPRVARWLLALRRVMLGEESGHLDVRRGVLAALVTATGSIAAVVWGWRPPAAGGEEHQVVARWTIPGGEGRFVALRPDPGANDLHAVAARIREDFARHENGVAMIFDDVQAARDVRRGSRHLGEERFLAALRHQRAMYLKGGARGEESFVIYTDYPLVRETFRYPVGGTARPREEPRDHHETNRR